MDTALVNFDRSDLQGHTILIIDDEPANLGVMSDYLVSFGLRVLIARDGQSGLEKVHYARPDLILLDVLMPGMDGFETCRRLKAGQNSADIPVIFMTALTSTANKVKGFMLGGVDYITKPFQHEEVLVRISTHLRLRALTRELERAKETLEQRVEERTAELAHANVELQAEVAERKRAEKALRGSEERYRGLFEGVPVGLYRTTPQGQFLDANPTLVQMLGYLDRESLLAENVINVYVDREDREQWQAQITREGVMRDFEVQLYRSDGTIIWVKNTGRGVTDADGRVLYYEGSLEEITERKRAEKERERLLAQIRDVISTVPEGVILLDVDARVLHANPAASEYLAILADAQVGDTLTHLGQRPIAELLTSPPQQGLWHEITLGAPSHSTFEMIARPMEAGAETEGWVLVIRDVTQEREIQRHIQQQDRLAAVGQLTAGIAHDFNNILAVIVLYAQMVQWAPDLPPKMRKRIETITQQAYQATNLIQQILDFSRRSVLERRPLDLVPLLKELVKLLQRTLPENIQVEVAYEARTYTVNADPTRVQQVFMNLAVNARDAMPAGGTLRIGLDRLQVEDQTAPVAEMKAGDWVQITVTDTGVGIPPDVMPRIFDPFFTTKAPGEGTGLGLAQIYGIVKQHEGHVDASSKVGEGTTFTLYLPALTAPGEEIPAEVTGLVEGQGETVLIVDDNATVREALRETLEALNYRVLEAGNGQEALAIVEQYATDLAGPAVPVAAGARETAQRVDLVVTDLVMPIMGGQALFWALRQQDPDVKVVVMTGHPLDDEMERLRSQGLVDLLKKPLNMEQLAQVVAWALRKR